MTRDRFSIYGGSFCNSTEEILQEFIKIALIVLCDVSLDPGSNERDTASERGRVSIFCFYATERFECNILHAAFKPSR